MSNPNDASTTHLAKRSLGADLSADGTIYDEEVRYCWVDEDGARVSPVHRDFGKALSWISDWPEWRDRIDERELQLDDRNDAYHTARRETESESIAKARKKLTLTGKQPVRLRRLVLRTTVESIVDHEAAAVDHTLSILGLS